MNEILHLEIHDWNEDIEDQRILDLYQECLDGKLDRVFFNFSVTSVDMAVVICITTTKEDLVKYGLEFLDNPVLKPSICTPNCWRKYNPDTWKDPKENGRSFNIDSYFRNRLWLCVDRCDFEFLTNMYPHRLEEWTKNQEKTDEYYKGKWKPDFFNNFNPDEIPVFTRYVFLPTGFIESWLGRKLTYQDEPVEYKTFNFEDIDLWGDDNDN